MNFHHLEMEPQTCANQVLPQIATLVSIDLGARIIEVVVFDKGAELGIPIIICACDHLPREVRVICPSATVKGATGEFRSCYADSEDSLVMTSAASGARVSPAAAACKSLEGLPGTNWLGSLLGRLSSTT